MRKTLLWGLLWLLLTNLLIKPFWLLGVDLSVQKAVGTETYGLYLAVFNLAYIFNILLDLGVTNFNTRNIARNPLLVRKHLSGILSIKAVLLAVYAAATFAAGALLGYGSRQFALLAWLCLNQFLNSLITYLRSNFQGLLMFGMDSLLSVLDRVLMILICGLLLWGPGRGAPFRIEWFVYAQTAAYVAAAAAALAALWRKVGWHGLTWGRPFTVAILRRSAPYALLVLLMASYNRLDPVLLQRLLPATGNYQAGIYGAAFRLLDALTTLTYLVSVPLLPVFARQTQAARTGQGGQELRETARMMSLMVLAATFAIAAACGFFGQPILHALYGDKVSVGEVLPVFLVIVAGFVPIGLTYVFGTLLTANGSLRQLNILASVALALNVGVNLVLIPRHGAVGAAWASLAAQAFMGVSQTALACRLFRWRPSWGLALRVAAYMLAVGLATWALARGGMAARPWLGLALAALLAVALASLLRLLDIREMARLLLPAGKGRG